MALLAFPMNGAECRKQASVESRQPKPRKLNGPLGNQPDPQNPLRAGRPEPQKNPKINQSQKVKKLSGQLLVKVFAFHGRKGCPAAEKTNVHQRAVKFQIISKDARAETACGNRHLSVKMRKIPLAR